MLAPLKQFSVSVGWEVGTDTRGQYQTVIVPTTNLFLPTFLSQQVVPTTRLFKP